MTAGLHLKSRRTALRKLAFLGGASALSRILTNPTASAASSDLKNRIGVELFTVRDEFMKDPDAALAVLAQAQVKEVEPWSYVGLTPKQFRELLDRHGMSAPSTHGDVVPGPEMENQLEGLQLMGIKYTRFAEGGRTGRGGGAPGSTPGARPEGAAAPARAPAETLESMKTLAASLNDNGRAGKTFGIKALYHNHTTEFEKMEGGKTPYDVLLAETDPELVAMQLDVGWASIAGQDIVEMFQKNPGRYELWHIKDAINIKYLRPEMNQLQRRANVTLVPVGLGEVNYKTIFDNATLAGLKHFAIEQDNAASWGDSMAATRVAIANLQKILA